MPSAAGIKCDNAVVLRAERATADFSMCTAMPLRMRAKHTYVRATATDVL